MGRLRQDGQCCGREAQCGRRTKINRTKTAHNTRICICICGHLGLVSIHTHTHTPLCGYGLSTGPTDGLSSWWLRNRYPPTASNNNNCLWLWCSVQEYFVKRANRGLLPSTHLIVNAAEGSKYNAAKKWALPAVSKLYVAFCYRVWPPKNQHIHCETSLHCFKRQLETIAVLPNL